MNSTLTRYEALMLAVTRAGGQQNLADKLEVSQSTVSVWCTRSKQLPAEYVLKVEYLFDVSRFDLRPDIYPRRPKIVMATPDFIMRDTGADTVII